MTKTDTIPCSKCGAQIPPEDFTQGLAVRDQGQSICKICVDGGADSNSPPVQRQPLMQQNIYRFSHDDFDELNRFTFLTAGHIALHRRVEREQGAFNPPELDDHNNQETRVLTPSQAKRTTRRETPLTQQSAGNATKNKHLLIIGVVVAVIVLILGAIVLNNEQTPQQKATGKQSNIAETKTKERSDYPDQAIAAWSAASAELSDDHRVLISIRDEVIREQTQILNKAAELIEAKDSSRAHAFLDKSEIPDHPFFTDLNKRKTSLIEQRNQLIAGTTQDGNETNNTNTADEQTAVTQNQTTPIPFAPLLTLNTGITRSTNLIGNDERMGLAKAFNCSNDNFARFHSYKLNKNGYILITENITYPHSFSLSFFFRLDPQADTDIQWLLSHGKLNSEDSINIYLSQGHIRTVIGYNATDSLEITQDECDVLDGNWHNYMLITNKENGASVFLDGKLLANNGSISGPLKPSSQLVFGASNDKQHNLNGSLALVEIYNGTNQDTMLSAIQNTFSEIRKSVINVAQKEFDFSPATRIPIKPHLERKDASKISRPIHKGAWNKNLVDTTALEKRNIKVIAAQDYDNDGDWDIIGISDLGRFCFSNQGNGELKYTNGELWAQGTGITLARQTELRTCDLNSDGLLDIIEFSPDTNGIHLFVNNGGGKYTSHKIIHEVNRDKQRAGTADFNNDHRPDLFFQSKDTGTYVCVFNPGLPEESQEWPFVTFKSIKDGQTFEKCVAHDFNGDQFLDVLFTVKEPDAYVLFINNKDRSFTPLQIPVDELPPFTGFRTYIEQGQAKLLANINNEYLAFLTYNDTSFELTNPVFEFVTLKDTKQNPLKYYVCDLNDDNNSDFIHLDKSYKLAITVNGETSVNITDSPQTRSQKFCYADFNGDGYLDFCHISARHNKNPNMAQFLRVPTYKEPKSASSGQEDGNTATPGIDPDSISYPVIISRLEADGRSKYINIYNEGIDRNSENMLYETAPMLNGDYREVLDPYALEARSRGRECSVTIEVDKRDASNGGLALIFHPMDSNRKEINIVVTDGKKNSTPPLKATLTGNDWQFMCFDLTNSGDDFDASDIAEIEIKDLPDTTSIPFLVHRILFYRDHVPSLESIRIKPGISPNQVTFNTDKEISSRIKKEKVVILLHQELLDKSDYALELRREISSVIGEPLDADNVFLLGSDTKWVSNNYRKSILKKKKPHFVIAVGAGNNLNKDPNHQENLTFWKAFIQTTLDSAVPIVCFGPHPGHSPGSKSWEPLIDGLNKYKGASRATLVDMTKIPYITNGRFGRNLKEQSIKDICRAYYQTLAQIGDIEEP